MKPSKVDKKGFTIYTYTLGKKDVDLTLSYEKMEELCQKHNLQPDEGAGEALFDTFRDWLYFHKDTKDLLDILSFDIISLVNLFNQDLLCTAEIEAYERKD